MKPGSAVYAFLMVTIQFAVFAFSPAWADPVGTARPKPAIDHYQGYVDGPWGQIHYRVYGRADLPTVILLHKMVWSSVEFEHVQPLLAAGGVRSIAVDLPGYGYSDSPSTQPTAEDYADALLPVFDRFRIRKATLFGVHTGATIATVFAIRHPERLNELILDGPPIFDLKTRYALRHQPPVDRTPAADGSEFTRRWKEIGPGVPQDRLSLQARHEAVIQFFSAGPEGAFAHNAIFDVDLAARLKLVRVPGALITNPGDILHQAALEAHAERPDFRYVELDVPTVNDAFDNAEGWAHAVVALALDVRTAEAR